MPDVVRMVLFGLFALWALVLVPIAEFQEWVWGVIVYMIPFVPMMVLMGISLVREMEGEIMKEESEKNRCRSKREKERRFKKELMI